jgi:signal transduction histidine kinase
MKLAAHYNKASVIISVFVLLVSGLVYYLIINHIARQQLDSDLSEEIGEVMTYINLNQRLPKPFEFDEDVISFAKTKLSSYDTRFFDAPYKNPNEKNVEAGRAVSGLVKVSGQNYIVTIVESRENTEYLIQIISGITLVLTAISLVILIVTNRYVLNGLWKPFYYLLHQLQKFNIADTRKIEPIQSAVDEFNDLSDAVSKMSSRVSVDYEGLKAFTENASHEILTPLAIITSKLDMLIQDERLSADHYAQITDIYSAANRLSRLNQSLLLLVKIDNHLLQDTEVINIKAVILDKVQQFQEMIHDKNIGLVYDLEALEINASGYLIEVLINNLFSNAIRHNRNSGSIRINLTSDALRFENTGDKSPLNPDDVFERFYKGSSSDGTGLGLAIAKNICTLYRFAITYHYQTGMHCFVVKF